jgi:hypothetical protein
MDRDALWRALEDQVDAQLALQKALIQRGSAAPERQLSLALAFRLTGAVTAAVNVMAALKIAPHHALPDFLADRHLPRVPVLPKEGAPPTPRIRKTTASGFAREISGLSSPARGRIRVCVKSKGGAPRGNCNALKTGCHTKAFRDFRRAVIFYVRAIKAEMALLRTLLPPLRQRVVCYTIRPERCYVRTRISGGRAQDRSQASQAAPALPATPLAPPLRHHSRPAYQSATGRPADRAMRWAGTPCDPQRHAHARARGSPQSLPMRRTNRRRIHCSARPAIGLAATADRCGKERRRNPSARAVAGEWRAHL